jgi:hypothetical protein
LVAFADAGGLVLRDLVIVESARLRAFAKRLYNLGKIRVRFLPAVAFTSANAEEFETLIYPNKSFRHRCYPLRCRNDPAREGTVSEVAAKML